MQDRDAAGERAWEALQARFAGSEVQGALPQGKDANDDLLELGPEALRATLDPLTAVGARGGGRTAANVHGGGAKSGVRRTADGTRRGRCRPEAGRGSRKGYRGPLRARRYGGRAGRAGSDAERAAARGGPRAAESRRASARRCSPPPRQGSNASRARPPGAPARRSMPHTSDIRWAGSSPGIRWPSTWAVHDGRYERDHARLDGIYVLRTSEAAVRLSPEDTARIGTGRRRSLVPHRTRHPSAPRPPPRGTPGTRASVPARRLPGVAPSLRLGAAADETLADARRTRVAPAKPIERARHKKASRRTDDGLPLPRYPGRRTRDPPPQHLSGSRRPLGARPVCAHRANTDSAPRRTPHVPSTGNPES